MRIGPYPFVCGLAFSLALSGRALFTGPFESAPTIRLKTYNHARVPGRTLEQAQRAVTFIFKGIGVKAEWVTDGEPQFRILIVDKLDAAISSDDMFGYAPRDRDGTSSGMAYVAYGHVRELMGNSKREGYPPLDAADILTYLMAHEIGHLLLPAGSHTTTGIMHARWKVADFKLMGKSFMSFTPEQERLIKIQACRLSPKC